MWWIIRSFETMLSIAAIVVGLILVLRGIIINHYDKVFLSGLIASVVGVSVIWIVFYGFEYQKPDVDDELIDRLASIEVENIDMSRFEDNKVWWSSGSGLKLVDMYSVPSKIAKVYVEGLRKDDESLAEVVFFSDSSDILSEFLPPFDDAEWNLSIRELRDNTQIYILGRQSDRDFGQFPIIQEYSNRIYVKKQGWLIAIHYWSLKNDSDITKNILDEILI